MPHYMIEIEYADGYAAERPVSAPDVAAAIKKVDDMHEIFPGMWRTTGSFRQIEADEYLNLVERVAMPAVVEGVLADMEAGR